MARRHRLPDKSAARRHPTELEALIKYFITGYGLHASQSSASVLEVLRAALTSHGSPEEILTDNGSQYVTWRGKSAFAKELEKRGIKQVVAAPRRPQTLNDRA